MLTLWIVVIVLGMLQLFEIGLLMFLLRGLGKMKQAGALFSAKQENRRPSQTVDWQLVHRHLNLSSQITADVLSR